MARSASFTIPNSANFHLAFATADTCDTDNDERNELRQCCKPSTLKLEAIKNFNYAKKSRHYHHVDSHSRVTLGSDFSEDCYASEQACSLRPNLGRLGRKSMESINHS